MLLKLESKVDFQTFIDASRIRLRLKRSLAER